MNKRRVVVTGLGLVSPVGNTLEEFWTSLIEGRSGVSTIKAFDPSHFSSHIGAELKNFDPSKYFSPKDVRKTDKFVQYAIAASTHAVEDARLDMKKEDATRVGVIVGSGIGGLHTVEAEHKQFLEKGYEKGPGRISPFLIPMLIVNMATGQVSMRFGAKGPSTAVATACATANHAIGDSLRIIQRDEADVMIAGGSEAAMTHMGYGGFCALRALSTRNDAPEKASRPFEKNRDGFVMGEGAGVVIIEEMEHALKRGARIYCELSGYGMTSDAYHITAPDPEGDGAKRCMAFCIKDSGLVPSDVDYINAHGTSTMFNDQIETLAIKKVFGDHAKKVAISSTKSVTGHMLGAAAGVEFIASTLAIVNDLVPPTINYEEPDPLCDLYYTPNKAERRKVNVAISNSLGFGGHNATLLLRKFK